MSMKRRTFHQNTKVLSDRLVAVPRAVQFYLIDFFAADVVHDDWTHGCVWHLHGGRAGDDLVEVPLG